MTNREFIPTSQWPKHELDLLRRTKLAEATDDDFAEFLMYVDRTQLDPWTNQVYAVWRKNKVKDRYGNDKWVPKMTCQTSIDGLRLVAQRTGYYGGQGDVLWCGEDGKWHDVWLSTRYPAAAKVTVYRADAPAPTTAIAHWSEYASERNRMWQNMPRLMLSKVAESLALRKAFPQEMAGLYTDVEMMQADEPEEMLTDHEPVEHVDPETGEVIVDVPTSVQPASKVMQDLLTNQQRAKIYAAGAEVPNYPGGKEGQEKLNEWAVSLFGVRISKLNRAQASDFIKRIEHEIEKRGGQPEPAQPTNEPPADAATESQVRYIERLRVERAMNQSQLDDLSHEVAGQVAIDLTKAQASALIEALLKIEPPPSNAEIMKERKAAEQTTTPTESEDDHKPVSKDMMDLVVEAWNASGIEDNDLRGWLYDTYEVDKLVDMTEKQATDAIGRLAEIGAR